VVSIGGLIRQARKWQYHWARVEGNILPWVDLLEGRPGAARNIVRRYVHRVLGGWMGGALFGRRSILRWLGL
jgi:hypothetical protein